MLPLTAASGLWLGRRWACYASVAVGGALMIWILVEIVIILFELAAAVLRRRRRAHLRASLLRPVRRFFGVALPGERDA